MFGGIGFLVLGYEVDVLLFYLYLVRVSVKLGEKRCGLWLLNEIEGSSESTRTEK